MSEFYCRWSSTVAYKVIFLNYLKYWGSIVGGVLLSLGFYGNHTYYLYAIVFYFICLIFLNTYKFIMLC
jgi:hypothetical protein